MNTTNLLKIALRALANNKLRGFLTMPVSYTHLTLPTIYSV